MTVPTDWPVTQPLEAAELLLEPLHVEHAEEMALVLNDSLLHTYTGGRPATSTQLRDRYRRQVVGRSNDGMQLWFNWVLRHRRTQRAVGCVQATVSTHQDTVTAEVSWVVATAYQGQGYARQAVAAMIGWLRNQGTDRFVAHIHPEHRASMAVAARVGMAPTETIVDGEVRWVG